MKNKTKTKIAIVATIWFLTAFATTVWASGQITEYEFLAIQALKGEIGLNYTATRLKLQNLSIKEHVWKLLIEEGELSFNEAMDAMSFINNCENRSWSKYARNTNKDGSTDYGIWQLNDNWSFKRDAQRGEYKWKTKDDFLDCAYDVYCSTREAIRIYKEWGNSWEAWSCYNK